MTKEFNQSLYDVSLQALKENGVPEDLADKASAVIASDDPNQKDLGRTEDDKTIISRILPYFQGGKENE